MSNSFSLYFSIIFAPEYDKKKLEDELRLIVLFIYS